MLAVLWLATSLAHADVLLPPPVACPEGSLATSSHGWPWCKPTTCTTAVDCERFRSRWDYNARARFECRPEALCIRSERAPGPRGMTLDREVATQNCTASRACDDALECVEATRCVVVGEVSDEELASLLSSLPPPQTPASSAGCGVGLAATSVVAIAIVLLGLGALRGGNRSDERIAAMAREGPVRRSAVARELGRAGLSALDRYAAARADRVRIEADEDELVYVFEESPARERRES